MRKLVSGFAASLDGYIEGPNGEYDWILVDKEINFAEMAKRYDTYFYGKTTYLSIQKSGMPASSRTKHFVFSTSLQEVAKGYTLIQSDVHAAVSNLKNQPGKDIALFGGAGLLASLLNMGLVDEISISFIPVLLGSGKPMVELLTKKAWLHLESSRTYSNGTVQITYSVKNNEGQ